MKFLESIIEHILKEDDIEDSLIILPSKRSVIFLKEEFKKKKINIILPEIQTMEEFVISISGLRPEDPLILTGIGYKIYRIEEKNNIRPFKDFYEIFDIIIKDFNDIDLYLIDQKKLKDIELIFKYENPDRQYIEMMKIFEKIYTGLNDELDKRKTGYRGRIYRRASERSKEFKKYKNVFIAGFGIFTPSEEVIISNLINNTNVKIFFDIQKKLLYKDFESTNFIKGYLKKWPDNSQIIDVSLNKKIFISEFSLPVSQINIFKDIFDKNDYFSTLVLGDEDLLIPAISGVPAAIDRINITMGFPLDQTPDVKFLYDIFKLHSQKTDKGFYYKDFLDILDSKYIRYFLKDDEKERLKDSVKKGRIFFDPKEDVENNFLEKLLNWYDDGKLLPCEEIIENLIFLFTKILREGKGEKTPVDEVNGIRIIQIFKRLKTFFETYRDIELNTIGELEILLRRIIKTENIPYSGDPLENFQIMGLLETRCLDFKKTVILSVNEGIIPKGKNEKSFIPYDLRKYWNLSTYRENDILFSYYFYSLLFKSEEFYICYSIGEDKNNIERSRFIEQIMYENRTGGIFENIDVEFINKEYNVETHMVLKEIEKTPEMIEILKNKRFTPTGILKYFMDPVAFYYDFVLEIEDESRIGNVGLDIIGTIIHKILELFYRVNHDQIYFKENKELIKNIDVNKIIDDVFVENHIYDTHSGKPLLIREVIKKIIDEYLKSDLFRIRKNRIKILELEKKIYKVFPFKNYSLNLKGIYDRMEEENGVVRICDYKSGYVEERKLVIKKEILYDPENFFYSLKNDPDGFSKIFQLLFYGYLKYSENDKFYNGKLGMRIYSLRYPQKYFDVIINENKEKRPLFFEDGIKKVFEDLLDRIFQEIFDENIGFKKRL